MYCLEWLTKALLHAFCPALLLQPPLYHLLHLSGPGAEDLCPDLLGRLQLQDLAADRHPGLD